MAFFKVKVDGTVYELEKLTLGESRILKRDFGLADFSEFNGTDPDHLTGLLFLALKRKRPNATDGELLAEVEGIDIESFADADEDESEADPTSAADAATEPSGKSGKSRKTTGSRS